MKLLIFRLSSMGDIILATSVLKTEKVRSILNNGGEVHWVVSSEFASVIEGNPLITRLWVFDRKKSNFTQGWLPLIRNLAGLQFDEVIDLHGSLRTHFARAYFFLNSKLTKWKTTPKQRLRLSIYFLFKKLTPRFMRPTHVMHRYQANQVDLSYLMSRPITASESKILNSLPKYNAVVMPSAQWPAKCWPLERWTVFLRQWVRSNQEIIPVIVGTVSDARSTQLANELKEEGVISVVGGLSLVALSRLIQQAQWVLTNDTGVAHLAQALNRPTAVLFGPTASDQGFGVWGACSQAIESSLWCRPCGKDGRYCFRFGKKRYLCMQKISVSEVRTTIDALISTDRSES